MAPGVHVLNPIAGDCIFGEPARIIGYNFYG
jgi:hypothetical protein